MARIGIAGLGLIGTSFALALRRRRVADRVIGMDPDPAAVAIAVQREAIHEGGAAYQVLEGADIVIVATPPDAVVSTTLRAAEVAREGAVLMDVASVKGPIVRALEQALPPRVRYVGGHPMAGSELRGAAAADDALLQGRAFLVVPSGRSDAEAVDRVKALMRAVGMRPLLIDADVHDAVVAQISHVPYLLAVAAVHAAGDEALGLGGPAFDGFRRIAASPPDLWREICAMNRTPILRALGWVRHELDRLERAMSADGEPGAGAGGGAPPDGLGELLAAASRRAGGRD